MSTALIEKTWYASAPLLNIDQIPEYPEELLDMARAAISKDHLQALSACFYNEIAPGQLLADRRVLDFIIYTSTTKTKGRG